MTVQHRISVDRIPDHIPARILDSRQSNYFIDCVFGDAQTDAAL